MKSGRKRDMAAALLFLGLGAFAAFVLIPRGIAVPDSVKVAALSSDFWPRIVAYGAMAASALLLVEALAMRRARPDAEGDGEDEQFRLAALPAALRVAALIAGLFAFYASLPALGVAGASAALIFAMALFFGERRLWLAALLGGAVPAALQLFFRYAAGVPVPLGILGG